MTPTAPARNSRDLVAWFFALGFRLVFWAQIGSAKGPTKDDWPKTIYTIADYRDGDRVGILTGVEIAPGQFLIDADIDWAPGCPIAARLLPQSEFVYGRAGKPISHCWYTLPVALVSFGYKDIDATMLQELRGTTKDETIGMQSMAPPSIWESKADGHREPLIFRREGAPTFFPDPARFKRLLDLSAVGMILAKHLGLHGFGHEARLAWAGFLLRADVGRDDLIRMGEGMSDVCQNLEVKDVATVVDSTVHALATPDKKVAGGPALAKLLGPDGKKVVARINEWLGRDATFLRKNGGIISDSQENIRRAVHLLDITLSNNEFSEQKLIQDGPKGPMRPLDDAAREELWLHIDRDFHFRPTPRFFDVVLNSLARENTFHPVRDYLDALTWDGESRIDRWLITYGGAADREYVRAVSAIFLIAAVTRIRRPGAKYDEMVVLESPQGRFKSSAVRALCPREEWFSDDLPLNVGSKELIERTLGKWIVEASDLAGKRKTEIEQLKALMSRQVDGPARMAYAHHPVERPRHFILAGTTNSRSYLVDMTGNRRFWPVTVTGFDIEAICRVRDQLWAEAVVRFAAGASIRLPESLWAEAGKEQEARREVDAWEPQIEAMLQDLKPTSLDGCRRIQTNVIWDQLGVLVGHRDARGTKRIADIMHRLGYTSRTYRENSEKVRGYVSDERTGLELGDDESGVNGEGKDDGKWQW